MKKRIPIILLFALAAMASCKSSTEGGEEEPIKISGEFGRADSMKLYLVEISAQSGPGEPVDSAILGEGGRFSFGYPAEEPFLFMLYLSNNQFVYLIGHPGEEIEVKADGADLMRTLEVKGGGDAQLLAGLTQDYMVVVDKLESLWQEFKVAMKNKPSDTLRAYYERRYFQVVDDHAQYIRDFVSEHPDNLASLFALFHQYGDKFFLRPLEKGRLEDVKYFKMVAEGLGDKYPELKHTKAIQNYYYSRLAPEVKKRKDQEGIKAGSPAPAIEAQDREGKPIVLDSLRGKYVLVDFWASGNRGSRSVNPRWAELYARYKDQGFEIIQVSLDTDKEKWAQAIETDKLGECLHICDTKAYGSPLAKSYNVTALPANFLIGPEGKVIGKSYSPKQLEGLLQEELKR